MVDTQSHFRAKILQSFFGTSQGMSFRPFNIHLDQIDSVQSQLVDLIVDRDGRH